MECNVCEFLKEHQRIHEDNHFLRRQLDEVCNELTGLQFKHEEALTTITILRNVLAQRTHQLDNLRSLYERHAMQTEDVRLSHPKQNQWWWKNPFRT